MKAKGKKLVSLFLVVSLMAISCTTMTTQGQNRFESSKERRGATLLIAKKDGQLIEGELITVKPNSLLLLDAEGNDVSVDIADIKVIRIMKKSKAGTGALYGLLVGGVGGAVLGGIAFQGYSETEGITSGSAAILLGAVFGAGGALLGGLIGAAAGTDKKIHIEGMTDWEIQEALDKLRKKARIRDSR